MDRMVDGGAEVGVEEEKHEQEEEVNIERSCDAEEGTQ